MLLLPNWYGAYDWEGDLYMGIYDKIGIDGGAISGEKTVK